MRENDVYLSVVIPAWNGGERIHATIHAVAEWARTQDFRSEIVVVDDGSNVVAAGLLSGLGESEPKIIVLRNATNRGKGSSVARGMLAATGKYRVFIDADLAYPPSEISRIMRELEFGWDLAIACRTLPESRYVMSPGHFHYLYTRHLMSRLYNRIAQVLLLPGIHDTQAGLKGFSSAAASIVFSRLTITRFGFDLECLLIARAHNLRIIQTPVEFHYDNEPSTVRLLRDGAGMIADLAKVRFKGWRGDYS
ncbi:MAG TPA: glycosyltransferase [Burkholderiales bacterium]|nr:glycosyltransferase [Burkholderiales bacterium]